MNIGKLDKIFSAFHTLYVCMEETFRNIISVVVCTYNQEQTIGRALDSILRQQCEWGVEIIIGDDCSSDRTADICRDYASRYPEQIRYIRNERNKGVEENYFDCLLMARGKYIADLAGDDEWTDTTKLERQRRYMEEHPQCVMLHTDYDVRCEQTGSIMPAAEYPYDTCPAEGAEMAARVLSQRYRPAVHLCTAMYRNDAFRRCYARHRRFFRDNIYPCEDMQLTALMAYEGTTDYMPQKTLTYTVSNRSISNSASERKAYAFKKAAAVLAADLRDYLSIRSGSVERAMEHRIYELLMHAFRLNDRTLRADALHLAHERSIRLRMLRTWTVCIVTSCRPLWAMALAARRIKKNKI